MSREQLLYVLIGLLLLPALLTNLGMMSLIGDEGIRTLVALEMDRSGNYIAPTLHGEFYYKKPPLFNWLVLGVFKLTGAESEWTARATTVFFLLVYGATIFYYVRRHLGTAAAVLAALTLITCGRMLFYDSMLVLIDTCFSWVMFLNFMLTFHLFRKQKWWTLMLVTYFLTAVGFLLKGLPALVFQATTLLTIFIWKREFRRLFHPPHFAGIGLLALVLGIYYAAYGQYNSLEILFYVIFDESSQRTAVNYGWTDTVLHLFTFPFEMTYHFLPWSLLGLALFFPRARQRIRENEFVHYCLLIFLTNLIVYWTSVEVYPRYLLMHAPLYFIVGIYLAGDLSGPFGKILTGLFGFLTFLMVLLAVALPWLPHRVFVPGLWWKSILLVVLFMGLSTLYYRWREQRLLVFAAVLLVVRLGFDWFVLPDRLRDDYGSEVRLSTLDVARKYGDGPLYIYKQTDIETTNGFYLTAATGRIVPRVYENFDSSAYYIVNPTRFPEAKIEVLDVFKTRNREKELVVGRLVE